MTHEPTRPAKIRGFGGLFISGADQGGCRIILRVLLVLSIGYFTWRGPLNALFDSKDLAVGYAAARCWIGGDNPYLADNLIAQLAQSGAADQAASNAYRIDLLNIYFPGTLATWIPLARAPWPMAKSIWLGVNLICTLLILGGLAHLLGWRAGGWRLVLLAAFFLALSPVHTTIAMGQAALLATAALVGGMLAEQSGRQRLAGLCYALATLVKMQIGLPFLAYLAWRRRWRTLGTGVLILFVVTVGMAGRMQAAGIPWYGSWRANLAATASGGGHNDPLRANPGRYSLINLQYPLHELTDNRLVVNAATLAIVGAAALATVWLIRGCHPRQELLALSLVAVLGLLVAYHRSYDAVLLVLPLAWAIDTMAEEKPGGRLCWPALLILLLCADFLVPAQTAMAIWGETGWIPDWLLGGWIWRLGLMCQQVWALVLMVVILLWAATKARPDQAVIPD